MRERCPVEFVFPLNIVNRRVSRRLTPTDSCVAGAGYRNVAPALRTAEVDRATRQEIKHGQATDDTPQDRAQGDPLPAEAQSRSRPDEEGEATGEEDPRCGGSARVGPVARRDDGGARGALGARELPCALRSRLPFVARPGGALGRAGNVGKRSPHVARGAGARDSLRPDDPAAQHDRRQGAVGAAGARGVARRGADTRRGRRRVRAQQGGPLAALGRRCGDDRSRVGQRSTRRGASAREPRRRPQRGAVLVQPRQPEDRQPLAAGRGQGGLQLRHDRRRQRQQRGHHRGRAVLSRRRLTLDAGAGVDVVEPRRAAVDAAGGSDRPRRVRPDQRPVRRRGFQPRRRSARQRRLPVLRLPPGPERSASAVRAARAREGRDVPARRRAVRARLLPRALDQGIPGVQLRDGRHRHP